MRNSIFILMSLLCVLAGVKGLPRQVRSVPEHDEAVKQLTEFLKSRAESVYDDFFNKKLQTADNNPELQGKFWWPNLPGLPSVPVVAPPVKPPVVVAPPAVGVPKPPPPPFNVEPCNCNVLLLSCTCCASVNIPVVFLNSRACGVVYFNIWILSTVIDVYVDNRLIFNTVLPVAG